MTPDLVGILENTYRLEREPDAWMKGIVDAVGPCVDEGLGVGGVVYHVSAEGHLTHQVTHLTAECSTALRELVRTGLDGLDPAFVRRSYLSLRVGMSSEVRGWRETQTFKVGRTLGVTDALGINGMNPGGTGCLVLAFRATMTRLPSCQRERLTRVALHLATAHRLRMRMGIEIEADPTSRAEAIVDPSGEVQHAIGPATLRPALQALREAVVDVERARGRLRYRDPEQALVSWRGLVAGRWTLVEHFEQCGRRYLLARENKPHIPEPATLSRRERQVLAYAAMGHSNKEIAYELGIAHSTVKVLLFRAGTKLKARTRTELLERFAEHKET